MDDYEQYYDEVMSEIAEEMAEYSENIYLSEEEGWFYADGESQ
jgi:hypothetical protein